MNRLCVKCGAAYEPTDDPWCGSCRAAFHKERAADFELFCRVLEAECRTDAERLREAPMPEGLIRRARKPPRVCERCGRKGGKRYAAGWCGECRDEVTAKRQDWHDPRELPSAR